MRKPNEKEVKGASKHLDEKQKEYFKDKQHLLPQLMKTPKALPAIVKMYQSLSRQGRKQLFKDPNMNLMDLEESDRRKCEDCLNKLKKIYKL